jgi:pimeloyl-ACP methyl ester carboxylesterase
MRITVSPSFTIEYDDVGQGTPLVLLHAFPLAREMWRPQAAGLADSYRLITPDLRGFGGTGGFEAASSIDQMADDVVALLDALSVKGPVAVGGLSMGGYVALAFARRHASRLRALILADTRAEPDNAEAKANRERLIAFAETHAPADVLEQLLPKLVCEATRSHRTEVVEEIRRIASGQPTAGVIGAIKALRERPDATPSVGGIRVPTLVIVGREDSLTPPALAQSLAAAIPGARLEEIEDAGHLSSLEQPVRFNAAVRRFLQSNP